MDDEYERLKTAIDLSAAEGEPWDVFFALRDQIHEARQRGDIPWDVAGELQSRLEVAWETGHDDEMERRSEEC